MEHSLFLFLKSTKLEVRSINMQPDTATDLILVEPTLRKLVQGYEAAVMLSHCFIFLIIWSSNF